MASADVITLWPIELIVILLLVVAALCISCNPGALVLHCALSHLVYDIIFEDVG